MKLPMQNLNSIFATNINSMDSGEVDSLNNVPMSAVINTDTAFLAFRSPWDRDYPNRPYLHILGSLQQLNGDLPYDIDSIYTEHNTTRVDAYYEFSNDQLSDLVKKGLYERSFEVPEQIKESQLEVDVNCDFKIVKPDPSHNINFPIVFAQVNNLRNLQLNQENSGYDLAEYFEKARVLELDKPYQEANSYQVASENKTKEENTPVVTLPKDDMIDFTDHSLEDGIVADEPVSHDEVANTKTLDENQVTDSSDLMDEDLKQNTQTNVKKPEPKIADDDLIKKARERIAKRKAKIAQEAKAKAKKQKSEKKQKQVLPDTEHDNNEYRNNVRVNQVNNEQADLTKQGIVQETIPETASDFENINDEKLDKKSTKKQKKRKPETVKPIDAPSVNSKIAQNDGLSFS